MIETSVYEVFVVFGRCVFFGPLLFGWLMIFLSMLPPDGANETLADWLAEGLTQFRPFQLTIAATMVYALFATVTLILFVE